MDESNKRKSNFQRELINEKMRMFLHDAPRIEIDESSSEISGINRERQVKMKKELQISPEKLEKKFL